MDDITHEPQSNLAFAPHLEDSFTETRRLRHDGWDGPKKASFCRTLAETGVVVDACRACDMSAKSAYALRQRDAVFAQAWEAALSMARQRLADELLARSLKGSVDQIMNSDGAIAGERHHFDNRLAFAILRRLDRRAELGATFKTPPPWAIPEAPAAVSGDWQLLLDALSDERTADAELLLTPIPPALSSSNGAKGNEGNNPPFCDEDSDSLDDDDDEEPEERDRVWHDWQHDEWRTDFPAPAGFDGDEYGRWDDAEGYARTLTPEEMAALAAAGIIEPLPEPVTLEEDIAQRDAYFAALSAMAQGENCEAIAEPGRPEAKLAESHLTDSLRDGDVPATPGPCRA